MTRCGPVSCCGVTKKGQPCKNSVKVQDTKIGHRKLAVLAKSSSARDGTGNGRPNNLASNGMKQPSATRRECHMALEWALHQLLYIRDRLRHRLPLGDALHQTTLTSHHLTGSDKTHRVPWHVSPAQPAILTSVANIWAGVQDLTLKDLTLSDEVDNIHCVFCLDEDLRNESVILRCQCKALSHLACTEEWLEKRSTGFGTSCCVCRNEGPLDALIRPLRVQSSDAETRHIHTANESSPERELATLRNLSPNDPGQSQPRQQSVGPQGRSVEQSVENGPRRSARLEAHLARGPSTSAPPR
ncbi:hypothetical protein PENNAL_c0186G02334, partial [Penicillium nalgiovense]